MQRRRDYAHRLAGRVFSEFQHQFVQNTVRFRLARRAWLRAADVSSSVQLRRELVRLHVFPDTVTASLDSLGILGCHVTMLVGSPWDQVAAQMWWDEASGYEPPISGLVAALGRRSERALVVGANTGFYCLVLGLEPNGLRIDAVEPWPPAVERLRRTST